VEEKSRKTLNFRDSLRRASPVARLLQKFKTNKRFIFAPPAQNWHTHASQNPMPCCGAAQKSCEAPGIAPPPKSRLIPKNCMQLQQQQQPSATVPDIRQRSFFPGRN
jgi:hypothetical protein